MSGLFKRARAYRTRIELLGETVDHDDFVLQIPDDERRSVLSGIDSMLRDDRIRSDESDLNLVARKKTFVLPLLLNIGAVVVLVAAAFILLRFFNREETDSISVGSGFASAEGRILDRLRRESEAELGARDREIEDIRSLLNDLENQKNLLAERSEAELAALEADLRHEFEADLIAERVRLTEEGVSGAELSSAMEAYESEVRRGLEADIGEARAAADAERQRRLDELDAQETAYEARIARVDADRRRIMDELDARDAEITRLDEQRRTEASLADEASRQLENLTKARAQDTIITDQIMAFYRQVGNARSAGGNEDALAALDALEQYLTEDGIRDSEVVIDRRDVDDFLIAALRNLVSLESGGDTAPETNGDRAGEILSVIGSGAVSGKSFFEQGDVESARSVWRGAFSALPELAEAFDTVLAASEAGGPAELSAADLSAARDAGYAEGLVQGRSEGGYAAADIERARREGYDAGRSSGLEETVPTIRRLESIIDAAGSRMTALVDYYTNAGRESRRDERATMDRLLDLLDTKLIIKSDLDPELHAELDEYTEAAASLRELESRNAVYSEILGFLSELSSELERP